jgi:1,4-dihydroxy-2-naphthoate octaprenyltransferase
LEKNKFLGTIKLCFTPFSIFSPIPFFCITLFLIAYKWTEISFDNLYLLFLGIVTSLISSGASNFWNHTNDITEDLKNNKKTLLTSNIITQREAILISIFLYFSSFLMILYISLLVNRQIFIFFTIWIIITWWYSDDIFLKKITRFRLKTHYFGEIITYCFAYPIYTLSIWLIFSGSFSKGLILSLIFLFIGLAGVLLKDLKDIKGDREAGLKTLGVVFSPSKLIKTSCISLMFFFIVIFIATNQGFFNILSFLIIFPFIYLLKNTFFYFHKKKWKLEIGDGRNIKSMVFSTYLSISMLGPINFI